MKNELRAPDKPYYPKNTLRTLRKTCVLTPDMKYIKWPSKKKVFSELVSVAVASIIIAMVIAAGDSIGMTIVNFVLKFF